MSNTYRSTIVFVTGNVNKLEEAKSILSSDINLIHQNIDLPEIQGTPDEIIKYKCKSMVHKIDGPYIIEDTCLCFNAIGGLPGPYIKWFIDTIGDYNVYKLLDGFEDKSAYALCTIAFVKYPGADPIIFRGKITGKIVKPRGDINFSWDTIFQPDNYNLTFSELGDTKNKISHRRIALQALVEYLNQK
jgi:inosine triphosphate pyrophosphatase